MNRNQVLFEFGLLWLLFVVVVVVLGIVLIVLVFGFALVPAAGLLVFSAGSFADADGASCVLTSTEAGGSGTYRAYGR